MSYSYSTYNYGASLFLYRFLKYLQQVFERASQEYYLSALKVNFHHQLNKIKIRMLNMTRMSPRRFN